jgi:hypothetical protein
VQGREAEKISADYEPELLYHYTTEKGLYGILTSGVIWATHYRFLNDLSECQQAVEIWREKSATDPKIGERFRQIEEIVLGELSGIHTFLVSFTNDGDDNVSGGSLGKTGDRLSQWRGYSARGQGYSLGFSRSGLEGISRKIKETQGMNARLLECLYGDEEKSKKIEEVFRTLKQQFLDLAQEIESSSSNYDQSRKVMAKLLPGPGTILMDYGAVFKHSSFREEKEWRIALSTTTWSSHLASVKFREADKVPFLEIPLGLTDPHGPLKRIVVGPSPSKAQSVSILEINLNKMGIEGVEVVPSNIPVRNW